MNSRVFEEEIIYSTEQSRLNQENYETIKKAIKNNYAVGFLTGFYDDALTISNASGFFPLLKAGRRSDPEAVKISSILERVDPGLY